MLRIEKVRQHLRGDREDATLACWPSLQETLREMFRPPLETRVALQFLRSRQEYGDRAAWRTFEQETGVRPDSLSVVRLRPALKRPEMLIVPELGRLLDEHRQRLRRRQEATRVREETATIRRGIRMYDSLDAALDVLAATGERRENEKALLERIPAVTYIKKAISPPNSNIAGRVACAVRREGLERRDHPNLPLELKHEPRDDFLELVSFLEREDLRRDASQAGLSAQERETFDLLLDGYDNTTISVLLDRSATQVRQEKHRALKKIKAHPRAAGL